MKKILIYIFIFLFLIYPVFAFFHWGDSTYTCNKGIPELDIDEQMDGCIEGQKVWWTFKYWIEPPQEEETLMRISIKDSGGGLIAFSSINHQIHSTSFASEPIELTKLEGILPAPTRGNTLTYTFCFDGKDKYGKYYDQCSSDTVNMYVLARSDIQCKQNGDCMNEDEFCKEYKCIKLKCGECQYISNHTCINYECCMNEGCEINKNCIDNKCELLKCNFLQKNYNHECRINYLILLILIVGLIIIGSGIYLVLKKKSKRKR